MTTTLSMKRNRVYVENPVVTSLAALVLLTKKLATEDVETWLSFRNKFLDEEEKLYGTLKCKNPKCGKENLRREVDMTNKEELKYLATIDHKKPLAKGGSQYDPENLELLCYPCNQKKGDNY